MYSISEKKFIQPDMEMVGRIIDKLNEKFDPTESYHHSSADTEMFEFHYQTDGMKREAWGITFLGQTVISGSEFGLDYSECQEESYLTLESRNEQKIFMLAVNGAINHIDKLIQYVALSDTSNQNKQKWIGELKKGIK
mgnify:CR=1 FL=1